MLFRIHRMKETAREAFRWATHTSGLAIAKAKDYEPAGEVEAASAYDAWTQLRRGNSPLKTGDILEDESGSLLIAKYVGFERAQWWTPEPKPAPPAADVGANGMSVSSAAPAR
jgi:hypothetical protein